MRDAKLTSYTPKATPGVTPEDILPAHGRVVVCDGGGGVFGHPAVSLRIVGTQVTCPYCSRTYVLEPGAGDEGHH